MQIQIRSIFLITLLALSARMSAQDAGGGIDSKKSSLGIHAGSQGFGINGAYSFVPKLAVRLSASYAPYGFADVRTWGGTEYKLDMKSKFGNALLQLEYAPFNSPTSGRFLQKLVVAAGGAYFFQAEATAKGVPTNDYVLGDLVIDKEDIGSIDVKSKWKSVAPYAGLGLRRLSVGKALALNIDLGSHYLSAPDVTLTGDKLLSNNEANEAILANNLKNYRWLPVVQLGLSYHF